MASIKIVESNLQDLLGEILRVEGKSKVNKMSFVELIELAKYGEDKLDNLSIPVKYRSGCKLEYSPSGPSSHSYKYGQGATFVMIVRKSSGWYLQTVERGKVYPKSQEKRILSLTSDQRDIAIRNFTKQFHVLPTANSDLTLTM